MGAIETGGSNQFGCNPNRGHPSNKLAIEGTLEDSRLPIPANCCLRKDFKWEPSRQGGGTTNLAAIPTGATPPTSWLYTTPSLDVAVEEKF